MSTLRPATVPTAARENAALLVKVFDQAKSERRPFKDEDDRIPPDGVLDASEFPSARFAAIDRLELSDGRITQAELARALAGLDADEQTRLLEDTRSAVRQLEGKGRHFLWSFGAFAGGGLALVGGLVLGGPVGLGLAGLGVLGVGGGFAMHLRNIFAAGRIGKALFDRVEAALAKLP